MSPRADRLFAYACLALSMSLVGSYVALSKPLAAAIPVFMLQWLRKPADERPMTLRTKKLLFLESFLGNFLFSICMLFGVSLTSAVSAGVIMAAIPAVVALLSWAFLRERIGPRIWAAVACAGLGIALLGLAQPVGTGQASGNASGIAGRSSNWLGNLLVFGAVLCEASYAVIG